MGAKKDTLQRLLKLYPEPHAYDTLWSDMERPAGRADVVKP